VQLTIAIAVKGGCFCHAWRCLTIGPLQQGRPDSETTLFPVTRLLDLQFDPEVLPIREQVPVSAKSADGLPLNKGFKS
jgi:hypothetical protein